MKKINVLCGVFVFCLSTVAMAQEKSPWSHESEASIVTVGGNTVSESYSAKQKTVYQMDLNSFTAAGRYLQTKAQSTETAHQWDASLRYERDLSEKWAAFVQQGAESDIFGGYVQRDNTDAGGKYFISKGDLETWFLEAGVRSQKVLPPKNAAVAYSTSGRLYSEYNKKVNESVSGKFWVEYLPNFKDSDAYMMNYEPSVSVMMSQVFSLKVAYLVKYHNKKATSTDKNEDTTFTTALVAKF